MEGGPARWRKVSDAVAGFLRADGKLAPIYAKVEKEVEMLEAKKAKADAKAAEDAKKAEAESVLKKLLAEGMSADEILAKLK